MPKDKTKNGNKSMDARIAFLQRAATYLTTRSHPRSHPDDEATNTSVIREQETEEPNSTRSDPSTSSNNVSRPTPPASARLVSHLYLIAQKSQIRLPPSTKHQICKRCSTLLVEGSTCRKFTENISKGGNKAHADVMVVECGVCGAKKRWPINARRQLGKGLRRDLKGAAERETAAGNAADGIGQGGSELK